MCNLGRSRLECVVAAAAFLAAAVLTYDARAQNLIVNGDFELGNVGFTSDYTFTPAGNTDARQYTVASNPAAWNPNFATIGDHTTGSGLMLIANGATTANQEVWRQTVPVVPGVDYDFSAWVVNGALDLSTLQFRINGVQIGADFTPPGPPPATWTQFTADWNAGAATTAQIEIVETTLSFFGNDFYLDDITFVPEPSGAALIAIAATALAAARSRPARRRRR